MSLKLNEKREQMWMKQLNKLMVAVGLALAFTTIAAIGLVAVTNAFYDSRYAIPEQSAPVLLLKDVVQQSSVSEGGEHATITETGTVSESLSGLEPFSSRYLGRFRTIAPLAHHRTDPPPLPDWVQQKMQAGAEREANQALIVTQLVTPSLPGAFNGQWVTYTIIISNSGSAVMNPTPMVSILPERALVDVQCSVGSEDCDIMATTDVFTFQLGSSLGKEGGVIEVSRTVTVPTRIDWNIPVIPANSSVQRQFSARITCQSEGASLVNSVFVQGGSSAPSNTPILVPTVDNGRFELSAGATWCSEDLGGSSEIDWADYDGDGDLDLALALQGGVAVYRNDNGQLTLFWETDDHLATGARWVDLITTNTSLELVVVGDFNEALDEFSGINYIYQQTGNNFSIAKTFLSEDVLWRVAPADFDRDGDVDLAAASYIDPGEAERYKLCLIRIYENTGEGTFSPQQCLKGALSETASWSSVETDRTSSLAWGDYDKDGDLDLAVGNDNNQPNRLYRNNDGNLVRIWNSGDLKNTQSVAWGDFNADGDLDLAAANLADVNYVYGNQGESSQFILNQNPNWVSTDIRATTSLDWNTQAADASIHSSDDGQLEYVLPFDFDYFGREIKKINVHTNGAIELLEAGEAPCISCAYFYNTHVTGYHRDQGVDVIFAMSDDLYSAAVIEPLPTATPERVEITWTGTTYPDAFGPDSFVGRELMFKVILYADGRIRWKFFDINYESQYQNFPLGDLFSGLYNAEADQEYSTGLTLPQVPFLNPKPPSLPIRQRLYEFDPANPPGSEIQQMSWNSNDQSIPPRNDNVGLLHPLLFTVTANSDITRTGVSPNGIIELLEDGNSCNVCNNILYAYPSLPPPADNDYIFAANDDLKTAVFIEGYTDTLNVTWMGTTAADNYFPFYELAYRVTLFSDGRVRWKFFDMNYTSFNYSFFSGIRFENDPDIPIFSFIQGFDVHRWFLYEFGETSIVPFIQGAALAAGNLNQNNAWYQANPATGILQNFPTGNWPVANPYNTRSVAWGDFDKDGDFDLAVGNEGQPNQVYLSTANEDLTANPIWFSNAIGGQHDATYSVAWADYDSDGDLDLAVGNNNEPNRLYRNEGGALTTDPVWSSAETDATRSLAWADYDADGDLDLAVGNYNQPNRIYRNDNGNLTLVWSSVEADATRGIAWDDYDADGDPDMAAGNDGQPNRLYLNHLFFKSPLITDTESLRLGWINDLAWGDYNNDGWLDLAVGGINLEAPGGGFIHVFPNDAGVLNPDSQKVEDAVEVELFNLRWGDYDADGYLDLAGIFPNAGEVRVYHNDNGSAFSLAHSISSLTGTLGLDWADVNRDKRLELIISDNPPKIYRYTGSGFVEDMILAPDSIGSDSLISTVRAADHDQDGDLDLAFGNFLGSSLLFSVFAPHLEAEMTEVAGDISANSVAWGDADQDGDLDLLFGVGLAEIGGQTILVPGSKVYFNDNGEFSDSDKVDILASGIGPHWAAFGDGNSNAQLDIAIARSEVADENQIYFDGNLNPGWESPGSGQSYVLAWGDSDSDGDLDLLIGQNGPNILYEKEDNVLTYSELTVAPETDNTRSVAWGDYDNDFDLDFAVGNVNQPTRVYRNDGHNIFTLVWESPYLSDTQSVAWGDFDGDGDLDLAEGNGGEHLTNLNQSGQANLIYDNLLIDSNVQNPTTPLTLLPVWVSTELSRTTSLAWGDWDNDGDLDLAVGNYGEADQVYANTGQPGASRFRLLWTSALTYQTTAIAWGDYDGDGDLDLAASQDQIKPNGFYENNYISPSHLESNFVDTVPLPNNPSYLSIERPGQTGQAYFYSSAEILSGPLNPTVTIKYRIFDPDGTRDENDPNPPPGDSAVKTTYEFSLDGGGYWQTATPASGWSGGVMTMTRQGREASFVWDAPADAAISDQALFRITIIPQTSLGQVQRASASAVSPPFRVRGLNCIWPDDPFIIFTPAEPAVNQPVQFMGGVIEGSGVLTFSWDFGDQTTGTGQVIKHTFSTNNTYSVTLTVTGEACPIAGQMITSTIVSIGTGFPDTFLPVVMKSGGTTLQQVALSIPSPVEGLQGHIDRAANATHLSWQPNDPAEAISEYRIYRRSRTDSGGFQLFDTVPGDVTAYTDTTTGCGHMYYITAFNARGESPPSTASYFSLPCR